MAAIGRAGFVTPDFVKPGAAVIDVGMNRVSAEADVVRFFGEGSKRHLAWQQRGSVLMGDVHPGVADVAGALTPVPGGVGPLTIAMLMKNTLTAAVDGDVTVGSRSPSAHVHDMPDGRRLVEIELCDGFDDACRCSTRTQLRNQRVDLGVGVGKRAVGHHHVVRGAHLVGDGPLRREALVGLLVGQAVALHQSRPLPRRIARHDDDGVEVTGTAGLEQQRDVGDHRTAIAVLHQAAPATRRCVAVPPGGSDRLEVGAGGGIAEDHVRRAWRDRARPPSVRMSRPKRLTTALQSRRPGATASRARRSASMVGSPASSRRCVT